VIDADSAKDARTKIRNEGLMPTEVAQEIHRRRTSFSLDRILRGSEPTAPNKQRTEQVASVTRQIATLMSAGITLTDALKAVIEQAPDKQCERVYREVREKISKGLSFGEALTGYPAYFPDLYCNMVKSGEAAGNLDEVMRRLADFLQAQARMRNKVGAALVYPAIMVIIGTIVVAVLVTFVVPQVTQLLRRQGKELPLPTQILVNASHVLGTWWWLIILCLAAAIYLFQKATATERGGLIWDRIKLKTPVLGDLFLKQAISRFSHTFATLLRSGVPVMQALQVTRNILDNRVLAQALDDVHKHIQEGTDISTPLKLSGVFPPTVGYMIAVGEQSGNLDELLDKLADVYDEELEVATQKMTAVIEPMIIVVLAVVVGGIVVSIILPILETMKL
jgi:general secretion pathway protein F